MGAFFTNVQVRRGPNTSTSHVLDALRALAQEEGMRPCSGDEDPDRTIVVRAGPGVWLSVYDEATEDQDSAKLDALGKRLSMATATPTVTVLVHDSDVLMLALFRDGKCVDRVNSNPGYCSSRTPTKAERERASGNAAKWTDVLADGVQPDRLTVTWSAEKLFAEETLAKTATLIACPMDRIGVGYRYLDPEIFGSGATAVLRLRWRIRPKHESLASGPPELSSGLPAGYELEPAKHVLAVGDELRVSATCRNVGGPSQGLGVRVWGTALDNNLLRPSRFELLVGNVMKGAKHTCFVPQSRTHDGQTLWFIDTETEIPAGVQGGLEAMAGSRDWRSVQEAISRSQVHVNVIGDVIAPGSGALHVALVPLLTDNDSAFVASHQLSIDPPLYRPLRADLGTALGASSHVLRPLSRRNVLSAMIVYDGEPVDLSDHAARAFERFASVCPVVDRYEKTIFLADTTMRPKSGTLSSRKLFGSKRWRDVVDSMRTERQLSLAPPFGTSHTEFGGGHPSRPGHGFVFGRPILPPPSLHDDAELTALILWVRLDGLDAATRESLTSLLTEIADEAIAEQGGVQAFLTRWGQEGGSPDATPYEQACGLHGPMLLLRSWCTRWLRAVGNSRIWLGSSLCSHLGEASRARLERVAIVRRVGTGLRVELRDDGPDTTRSVEEALAELLPSREDARVVQGRIHRRG